MIPPDEDVLEDVLLLSEGTFIATVLGSGIALMKEMNQSLRYISADAARDIGP